MASTRSIWSPAMGSSTQRIQFSQHPKAFTCSGSNKIMDDPVLALCGHLFDKNVLNQRSSCPIDGSSLIGAIELPELKNRINAYLKPAPTHEMKYEEDRPSELFIGNNISAKGIVKKQDETPESNNADQERKQTEDYQSEVEVARIKKLQDNIHFDDIHGLERIASNAFVSGSKDATLKMWDLKGTFIKALKPQCVGNGYQYWVTALESFGNGLWASGTRSGDISIWNDQGEELNFFNYHPSRNNSYVCKDRNKQRINCITKLKYTDNELLFYTGTPGKIQLWDGNTGKLIRYYNAAQNDWVYCIELLENNRMIVVIGSDLEVWDMKDRNNPSRTSIIQEDLQARTKGQRPHISSILRLEQDQKAIAAALFDGSVKIVDVNMQKQTINYTEHQGRVWNVIHVGDGLIASGADDKTIKIWDIRQKKSACTLSGNSGRVSALLRTSQYEFISGSCPDDGYSKEKASFTFWSLKNMTKK
jgi:WD40 repeat protein